MARVPKMPFLVMSDRGRPLSRHRTLEAAMKAAKKRVRGAKGYDVVEVTAEGEWLQGRMGPDGWSPV